MYIRGHVVFVAATLLLLSFFMKHTLAEYGEVWFQRGSAKVDLVSITSDSSGKYLAAAPTNGFITASSDYGSTWTICQNSPFQKWYVKYLLWLFVLLSSLITLL